eukprot:scaffold327286_cov37-Prasinocladus_malaysianus.AAC.1
MCCNQQHNSNSAPTQPASSCQFTSSGHPSRGFGGRGDNRQPTDLLGIYHNGSHHLCGCNSRIEHPSLLYLSHTVSGSAITLLPSLLTFHVSRLPYLESQARLSPFQMTQIK